MGFKRVERDIRGFGGVHRYAKGIPWGHGVGLLGFLMMAYMPVYYISDPGHGDNQLTEQPPDHRAGLD